MNNVTVLYFMTTGWTCSACKGFYPHIVSTCNDMGVPLEIIDISKSGEDGEGMGVQYNICGLPTVVVLHNGIEVGRIDNGVTKQGVIDLIKSAKED